MDSQQVPPPAARLDSNVVAADADDWARSTQSALGNATYDTQAQPSATVPGASHHVLNSADGTAIDTSAKSQSAVDGSLNKPTSTVSTPGVYVPGAWTDKPSTEIEQIYADVGNALASVGQAAFNVLPEGLKSAVSSSPTKTTSPIQTTTNNNEPKPTLNDHLQTAGTHASNAAITVAGAATAAATTLGRQASSAYNQLTSDSVDTSKASQPAEKIATLPSQDTQGQLPYIHTHGVGALPGRSDEQGVALLPDQRDSTTKLPQQPMQSTPKGSPSTTATVASAAAGAGAAIGAKATDVYNNLTAESVDKSKPAQPVYKNATLPSQDVEGQQTFTHTDGVGALLGNVNEQSVAVLPEERDASMIFPQQAAEFTIQPSRSAGVTTGIVGAASAAAAAVSAGAGAAYNKAADMCKNPSSYMPAAVAGSTAPEAHMSLPSEETEGQQPFEHSDGVGALPGRITEESVAKLPEEKANPDPLATATQDYAAANKNTRLASPYNPESPYSDTRANAISQPTTKQKVETKAQQVKEGVREHVQPSSKPQKSSSQSSDTSPTDSSSTGTSPKKSGFISKLKGEVKIISGKLSHNEERIEEGRALKSGGQP